MRATDALTPPAVAGPLLVMRNCQVACVPRMAAPSTGDDTTVVARSATAMTGVVMVGETAESGQLGASESA